MRGRYAISGVYPPVKPVGAQRSFDFDSFSNASGTNYAKCVLVDRVEQSESNEIYVHKRVRIMRRGAHNIELNEELTNLSADGLKVTSVNDDFWKIELLYPETVRPLNPPQAKQPLDEDKTLKVYKKYGKKVTGYSPHRWPAHAREKVNGFRHPESLSEERLQVNVLYIVIKTFRVFLPTLIIFQYLTGVSPKSMWVMCDVLKAHGLKDSKTFTIPMKVMLFLTRIRHGFSYNMLGILFNYNNDSLMYQYFYQCSFLHFMKYNEVCKCLFSNVISSTPTQNVTYDRCLNYGISLV